MMYPVQYSLKNKHMIKDTVAEALLRLLTKHNATWSFISYCYYLTQLREHVNSKYDENEREKHREKWREGGWDCPGHHWSSHCGRVLSLPCPARQSWWPVLQPPALPDTCVSISNSYTPASTAKKAYLLCFESILMHWCKQTLQSEMGKRFSLLQK